MNSELTIHFLAPILFFIIALLYASVGHGGASGYLAIMALMGVAPAEMKSSALLLNLLVSAIAFLQFRLAVEWNRKLFICLSIPSVVMAYWGSSINIDDSIYKKTLGVLLFIPVIKIILPANKEDRATDEFNIIITVLLGAVIGFISGMIGIGGGILLSPALIMLRWANIKQTAAISALFIFVNSLAGLTGQLNSGFEFNNQLLYWAIAALLGGLIGGRWGAGKLRDKTLRIILALVLSLAAFKLLLTAG